MLTTTKTLLVSVAAAALFSACGGAATPAADPSGAGPDAPAILTERCGTCHAEPAPGESSKADIETELDNHADRVELSHAEKQALIEHLGS